MRTEEYDLKWSRKFTVTGLGKTRSIDSATDVSILSNAIWIDGIRYNFSEDDE